MRKYLLLATMALYSGTSMAQQNKDGQEMPKEPTAEELYEKAFDYMYGRNGVIMDSIKAAELFEQSAKMGFAKAQVERACIEKSDSVALKWLLKAAAQDCHYAMRPLFSIYYNGYNDVAKNVEEAYKWLKKGAELGNPWCQWLWGYTYHFGEDGFPVNVNQAIYWLEKAANQDQLEAALELAELYDEGKLLKRDVFKVVRWYQKASDLGSGRAKWFLACFYRAGDGVDLDKKQAFKYMKEAAELDEVAAQIELGRMFASGEGCEKDIVAARHWLIRAREAGKEADNDYIVNVAKSFLDELDK